jgi:putative Mn2+ efflux pump MntP
MLLDEKLESDEIKETILEFVKTERPQSTKQLIAVLKEKLMLPEAKITKFVLELQAEGTIKLKNPSMQFYKSKSKGILWYQLTFSIGAIAALLALLVPENLYPWIYVRNFFGIIFILFLPGFSFIKAIFPNNFPNYKFGQDLQTIEWIALSVGLSIALVSTTGLVLYYVFSGINLSTTVIVLFVITSVCATIGMSRQQKMENKDAIQ